MSNEKTELEDINKKLRLGFTIDLRKPEIDKFERATIIRKVMDDNSWSIRQLATEIGISKSTIEDWLLFSKLTEKKYEELKTKGVTDTEIYKTLRTKSKETKENKETEVVGYKPIDYKITKLESDITSARNRGESSKYTQDLITELISELQKFHHSIRARK